MPVYENETYEQGVFRVSYPDVAAALEAGFGISAHRAGWNHLRRLAPHIAEIVRTAIAGDAMRFATDPALAWDCPNIPNGRYVVTTDPNGENETNFDFSIHLVQNGSLAGKRVVRFKFPGTSTYKAFAWLTRSGELSVWRAFRNDERSQAQYITMARRLLVSLRGVGREGILSTSSRNSWFYGVARDELRNVEPRNQFRITPQVRCFHCASVLSTEEQIVSQHCADHMPPPRVDPLERERTYAEERRARVEAANARLRANQEAAEATRIAEEERLLREVAQQPVPPVQGRRTPLPICEVTGSVVQ